MECIVKLQFCSKDYFKLSFYFLCHRIAFCPLKQFLNIKNVPVSIPIMDNLV